MAEGKGAYGPIALAAVAGAGGVLSLANPEGVDLIVTQLILDVITPSSGACTLDAGIAANGTTSSDTLIDGVDVATAGVYDSLADKGTNGGPAKWGSSQYLTITQATGAVAGLAGNAYIKYIRE